MTTEVNLDHLRISYAFIPTRSTPLNRGNPLSNQTPHWPPTQNTRNIQIQTFFQMGRLKNSTSISVAKIIPPSTLCSTIFLCKYLRLSSLTFNFRSKIISLPKNVLNTPFLAISPSPPTSLNFSHGRGCLLLNSSKKKQEPRRPERIRLMPMAHIGQAARPRQRVVW